MNKSVKTILLLREHVPQAMPARYEFAAENWRPWNLTLVVPM